jgi:hypothetical protein
MEAVMDDPVIPRATREALATLATKGAPIPDALVQDVARLHKERAAIKALEYAPDKELRLLRELEERWAADLEKHVTAEQQRAAAERDKELREVNEAERLATASPTKRPTETDGEFLGRTLAALHLRQQHSDHLRVAALDADFARDETDPSAIAALLDAALTSHHPERIGLTSRVVERRLRTLAEHETRTDAPNRPASAALARVTKQIADWRTATEGGTPAARRASAQARFDHAVQTAAQRVGYIKQLVGLNTTRAGR